MIDRVSWALKDAQQPEIERLMPAYLKEMALYTEVSEDANGSLVYPYLPHYWREPDRSAYLITDDHKDVGFALIRALINPNTGQPYHSMAEFFIAKLARRSGIGSAVAKQVLLSRPGAWEISVLKTNTPARYFWKQLLSQIDSELTAEDTGEFIRYDLTV